MLKKRGFNIAQRSAGSHSPIDVFGIDIKNRKIKLIQVKPDNFSDNAKFELENEWGELNDEYQVTFEVQ